MTKCHCYPVPSFELMPCEDILGKVERVTSIKSENQEREREKERKYQE